MNYDIKQSGERIRRLRIQNDCTQEKLAEALNIDRSLLSHVEAGKRGCSVDMLVRIGDYFNVSLDYIILGTTQSGFSERKQIKAEVELLIHYLEMFKELL